ncbi:MAG: histidine phosphatase family protein [Propionibacteriaceae bacterium]|jgi:probable phosphoglycerate mutase|nr:histidine phosphatase family protein [Propionibacteriaceae bacterium]
MTQLTIVRHGETEWSRNGRYTSITDLELTDKGKEEARRLGQRLDPAEYGIQLTSPRTRARTTAALAGFTAAEVDPDLAEWFYGDFEGRTTAQILGVDPSWRIWTSHVPGGEQSADVIARLTRVVNRIRFSGVDKAICFAHGHALRTLALCWIGLDVAYGGAFPLRTGGVSILGYEKQTPAILTWNS